MMGGLVGHSRLEGSVSSIGWPVSVSTDRTNMASGLESMAGMGEDCSSLVRQSSFFCDLVRRKKFMVVVYM